MQIRQSTGQSKDVKGERERERGQEDSKRLQRGGETWKHPEDKRHRGKKKRKKRAERTVSVEAADWTKYKAQLTSNQTLVFTLQNLSFFYIENVVRCQLTFR